MIIFGAALLSLSRYGTAVKHKCQFLFLGGESLRITLHL